MQKLGILGGTFNPIHNGHLAAAEEVRNRLLLDRVLFIPSHIPPHKHDEHLPAPLQRLEMVRLATSGNAFFEPSDLEINRGGTSYTLDTVEALRASFPGTDIYFITGLDTFLDIQTWHAWERLLGRCCFVVLSRPGYRFADLRKIEFMKDAAYELDGLDRGTQEHALIRSGTFTICLEVIPLHNISSTDIRRRIRAGISVKYLLPDVVETYIIENRLYV